MNYIAKTNDLVKIVTKSNSNNGEIFIGNISHLHDIVSLTNSSKNINNYDCTLFINEHPLHKAYGLDPYGCVGICVSDIASIEKVDKKDDFYQKKKRVKSEKITKKKALARLESFKSQTELSETMVGEDLAALEYAIKAVKEYKVRKYN